MRFNGWTYIGLPIALGFLGYMIWLVTVVGRMGDGWSGLAPIWPFVVGGLVGVGVLAAVLIGLMFYSSSRGFDEPPSVSPHDDRA
jgi:hypothetical protein